MSEQNSSIVEDIVQQWEKDAKIDTTNIQGEIVRTPILFSKYLTILASWKRKRTAVKVKLNEIRQLKTDYYNGELSLDDCKRYGWNQYQGNRPLKSALESMLSADKDVNRINTQLELIDNVLYIVEQILTSIKSRDFMLGNYIKYVMFAQGAK